MGNRRGQQIGEYAVLIGVVAAAFVGSQLYMSRRIAGSLIAVSTTVLGPPAPDTGKSDSTTTSTVKETGDSTGVRTQIASAASGSSSSGNVLAEAYGPYLGAYLIDNSSGTTIPLGGPQDLSAFLTSDITSNPNWMMDHAAGKDRSTVTVSDHTGDHIDEILGLTSDEDSTTSSGKKRGGLYSQLSFDMDPKHPRGKAMVTWLDSITMEGTQKQIKDKKAVLPTDDPEQIQQTDKDKKYQAFKAFIMNLRDERSSALDIMSRQDFNSPDGSHDKYRPIGDVLKDAFSFDPGSPGDQYDPKQDSLEQKLDRFSKYDITSGGRKVDLSSLSPDELKQMLSEAEDPSSALFKQLQSDGVFDDVAGAHAQEEITVKDSSGKVVMTLPAGGDPTKDWKTGDDPEYKGKVVYADLNGEKTPYGIQRDKGDTPGGGKLEIRFGTFQPDVTKPIQSLDTISVTSDGGIVSDDTLTLDKTPVGGFDKNGQWDGSLKGDTEEQPAVVPYVSTDSSDRTPKGWIIKGDGTKDHPDLFIPDANGNGVLEDSDVEKAKQNPIIVLADVPAAGNETQPATLQTDVPTGGELLAAGMTSADLKHVVLYRRFKPDSVPADARGSVPTGLTREGMTKAIMEGGRGSLVNFTRAALVAAVANATFTEVKSGDQENQPSIMRPQSLQDLAGSQTPSGADANTSSGSGSDTLNLGELQSHSTNDVHRGISQPNIVSTTNVVPDGVRR